MKKKVFHDIYERFSVIDQKAREVSKLINDRNSQIKQLENDTNQYLTETMSAKNQSADEYMKSLWEYDASCMDIAEGLMNEILNLRIVFESQIKNISSYQAQAEQISRNICQEYGSNEENINYIEHLKDRISRECTQCIQNQNSGLLGKILNNPNQIPEVYALFYYAQKYYDGLLKYTKNRYNKECDDICNNLDHTKNQIFKNADNRCEQLEKQFNDKIQQWEHELFDCMCRCLPVTYLQRLEQEYHQALQNMRKQASKEPYPYLPFGKIYCNIGYLHNYKSLYQKVQNTYGKYFKQGYLIGYAMFSILESRHLILKKMNQTEENQNDVVKLLAGYIKSIPAGNLLLNVCDMSGNIGIYKNIAMFISSYPAITGGKIITDKSQVADVLRSYIEIMDEIQQKKLPGYENITMFNQKNPQHPVPYRCLCISGFPNEFDDTMLQQVQRLLKHGQECGITVLLLYEDYLKKQVYSSINEMLLNDILTMQDAFLSQNDYWIDAQNPHINLRISNGEQIQINENMIHSFGKTYELEQNKPITLYSVLPKKDCFQSHSVYNLKIPIGMNENGRVHYLEMGDSVANGTSHYGLIAGPTGSGKSTLLHTIIMSGILSYRPEELELYLMDFKEGTEFKIYEDYKIPHIRFVALDAMQEFGESILNYLWKVLETRNEMFTKTSKNGMEIKNISDYRAAGYKMSRILVIIDEFQVLFDRNKNKKTADRCAAKMSDFISKGRVYGIHFLLATQTMHKIFEGGSAIDKSTLEEMHIRIGLQCQEKEIETLFGLTNYKTCLQKKSAKKGSGIYLENDIVSSPVGIQIAYLTPDKQKKLLSSIEKMFVNGSYENTQVFRGKSEPEYNESFIRGKMDQGIILGDPIHIGEPVCIPLNKKKKTNLLLFGDCQTLLDRICKIWIRNVLLRENEMVYICDGAAFVGEKPILSETLIDKYRDRVKVAHNVFQVVPLIKEIYDIYQQRKQKMKNGVVDQEKDIHLILSNYQWNEPIMAMMENRSISEFEEETDYEEPKSEEEDKNPFDTFLLSLDSNKATSSVSSKTLHVLIDNGYLCGIHVIMSCNDIATLKKVLNTDLIGFSHRIATHTMSYGANSYIDTDIDMTKIKDNTVVYSDGIHEPYLFKPYKM